MKIISQFGPSFKEFEIGEIVYLAKEKPLKLVCGVEIQNFPIAYQTYGKLNESASNAILICHALTGDQYVASQNPITGKDGWWQFMVGSGKAIDTDKFFVICSNVLGGCMGSFGPKNLDNGELILAANNQKSDDSKSFEISQNQNLKVEPEFSSNQTDYSSQKPKKNHQKRYGAVANQLFHNSEPLNDKGLLGWKLAKREDLQQGHYGCSFPMLTIADMVHAQNLLIEHFGIQKLHAVIGGSAGGMQALAWANLYPQKVNLVMPISTSYRHSPQNIAFHEVGRQAIMADLNWQAGDYLNQKKFPTNGLSLARMTAHITYLSESALQRKFGRNLKNKIGLSFSFGRDFEVENYLHHQGNRFVERFDPNSYLYITRAVDYFDLESDFNGNLSLAFADFAKNPQQKFCVVSFSDDWLFPPSESKKLTQSLIASGINASLVSINSNGGHDSFLLPSKLFENAVSGFLQS